MFGFVVGTVCLIGLIGLAKGARHRHHRHHWQRGRRPGRGRRGWARAAGEVLKRRLDIDQDQEDIVDLAVGDLQSAMSELGEAMKASRSDLSEAFRGAEVDQGALDALFAQQDEQIARTRREVVSALKQIHAVLDDEQRQRAADWLDRSQPGWV